MIDLQMLVVTELRERLQPQLEHLLTNGGPAFLDALQLTKNTRTPPQSWTKSPDVIEVSAFAPVVRLPGPGGAWPCRYVARNRHQLSMCRGGGCTSFEPADVRRRADAGPF